MSQKTVYKLPYNNVGLIYNDLEHFNDKVAENR